MAYVVIVCSRCRLARGARETARTASCPRCGRTLHLAEMRTYHRAESLSELAEAIGQLNASLKGGLVAYLEELGKSRAGRRRRSEGAMSASKGDGGDDAGPPPVPASRLDRAILAYLDIKGQGSARTIQAGLSMKASPEQVEKRLGALLRIGLVFEPVTGQYALVR